jgi:GTP-binding protein EngB required for normal cell division
MASRGRAPEVEDVWSILQRDKRNATVAATASDEEVGTIQQHIVFLGDAQSGKSSLIQTFLKPAAAKETRPTVSLDYNFARKTSTTNNQKFIAHFWEIGGDLTEPSLLEIPLNKKQSLSNVTFVVVCDLSKPHNCLVSVLRAFAAIREVVAKRAAELQATDVLKLKDIREKIAETYAQHIDANRVKPMDVSVIVVANKHDTLRSLQVRTEWPVLPIFRTVGFDYGSVCIILLFADMQLDSVL